jgi:hypothetical protein
VIFLVNRRTADGTLAKDGSAQTTLAEAVVRAGGGILQAKLKSFKTLWSKTLRQLQVTPRLFGHFFRLRLAVRGCAGCGRIFSGADGIGTLNGRPSGR